MKNTFGECPGCGLLTTYNKKGDARKKIILSFRLMASIAITAANTGISSFIYSELQNGPESG
jgi:hypothetical protein